MKLIKDVSILLMLSIAFTSCEREEAQSTPSPYSPKTINFSTEHQWPDVTKAITPVYYDLMVNGFDVWGAWEKDPKDQSIFSDDYADGKNETVFDGTHVSSVNNNGAIEWSYVSDGEYEREWYRGYYSFVALPKSAFNTLVQSASQNLSIDFSNEVTFTNELSLMFKGGLDLTVNQDADLICAFDCQDNSRNQSEVVTLDFKHMFVRLGIGLSVTDPLKMPVVTKVSVYGIPKSISPNKPFKLIQTKSQSIDRISASFEGNNSTSEVPYYYNDFSQEDFIIGTTDLLLLEDLRVFPQDLTIDTPLCVDIEYKKIIENPNLSNSPFDRYIISDETYTHTLKISNQSLEPGCTYTFKFLVDDMIMMEENRAVTNSKVDFDIN